MAIIEMMMPKMGESVMEGTVISWLKNVGEEIEEEESLLEVATDKVDTEIPCTHSGILKEILAKEGEVVAVGKPVAKIEVEGNESGSDLGNSSVEEAEKILEAAKLVTESTPISTNGNKHSENGKFLSPLVKNIVKEEDISPEELNSISGTGKKGRITKNDILSFLKTRTTESSNMPAIAPQALQVPISIDGNDEVIEMDRMRKMIAQRMLDSKRISAHVTSFVEADVTKMVQWRGKAKHTFKEKYGTILTYTPILIEAIVKAIKDYPLINVQVDEDKIIKKGEINIGMATALPSGNLIVPVIHNADKLNLIGLTEKVNDLAVRARDNKLKPDELQGGTYTVSNVGSFGNIMGTPIIMQPQVAIMAFGAIQKVPSVVETPEGDVIGIRSKLYLSHSYDHRVVDGALGGMFVRRVADYLERFDTSRNF